MATAGGKPEEWKLDHVGTLELEHAQHDPKYIGAVVLSADMLMVVDGDGCIVRVYNQHDGRLLATSDTLRSGPYDVCLMDRRGMQVAVTRSGYIEVLSVKFTSSQSASISTVRTVDLTRDFDYCYGVRALSSGRKLAVSGRKKDKYTSNGWLRWSLVTHEEKHDNTVHNICKYGGHSFSYLDISADDSTVYISCFAGHYSNNHGVYAFAIMDGTLIFMYRHSDLTSPTGISVDRMGYIYVCNWKNPGSIHQLTEGGQLMSIHREGVPPMPKAMFWDDQQEHLNVTRMFSREVWKLHPVRNGQQDLNIPVEVLKMDQKSQQIYKEALRLGRVKVYNIRVMVVGPYGAGKTTLTKRLLGQHVKISERNPTEGIDIHKYCCKVHINTREWIVLHEELEILDQLQPFFLPEVIGEQERPSEIYDSIDTINDQSQYGENDNDTPESSESPIVQSIDKKSHQPPASTDKADESRTANDESRQPTSSNRDTKMTNLVQSFNERVAGKPKKNIQEATMGIWDFAGHEAFHTTHQTFLTQHAIYLLVADLSKENYAEGESFCQAEDWLNSIHCCVPQSTVADITMTSNATENLLTSSAATSVKHPAPKPDLAITLSLSRTLVISDDVINATPPVILVGTHVDKIPQNRRQEHISRYWKKICSILKDKPTLQHLVDFIAIDNTKTDPLLKTLQNKIVQLAAKQAYWGEEVPTSYILMEEQFRKLRASGKKVISLSELGDIDKKLPVPIQNEDPTKDLDVFLRLQHVIGNIIYFSAEGLRENIVLDPQWLVDAQKSLITTETFIHEKGPDIEGKWLELRQQGKLTHELIDSFWTEENNSEFHDKKELILKLLEQLNIITKPWSFTEDGGKMEADYFLVPCMLSREPPKEVISHGQDTRLVNSSILSFVFVGKFLPPPIFHRLLAACVAKWQVAKEKSEYLIFSGYCVFDLDLFHRLTLRCRNHVVFARITRMVIDDTRTLDTKWCTIVRKFITLSLKKVISYLDQNLPFELYMQCLPSCGVSEDGMVSVASFQMWYADEGHDPGKPLTHEHMNYGRLCIAMSSVSTEALKNILITHVPVKYPDINQAILANRKNLSSRGPLTMQQIALVFPDPQGQTVGCLDDFDVSLLYILIRNVSSVTEPVTGWGHPPTDQPSRDTTLGASVERIRICRNDMIAHNSSGMITKSLFDAFWNNIETTICDIECVLGGNVWSTLLERQRKCVVTIYEAHDML